MEFWAFQAINRPTAVFIRVRRRFSGFAQCFWGFRPSHSSENCCKYPIIGFSIGHDSGFARIFPRKWDLLRRNYQKPQQFGGSDQNWQPLAWLKASKRKMPAKWPNGRLFQETVLVSIACKSQNLNFIRANGESWPFYLILRREYKYISIVVSCLRFRAPNCLYNRFGFNSFCGYRQ